MMQLSSSVTKGTANLDLNVFLAGQEPLANCNSEVLYILGGLTVASIQCLYVLLRTPYPFSKPGASTPFGYVKNPPESGRGETMV